MLDRDVVVDQEHVRRVDRELGLRAFSISSCPLLRHAPDDSMPSPMPAYGTVTVTFVELLLSFDSATCPSTSTLN